MKKIIQRAICSLLSAILFAPLFMGCDNRKVERHTFSYDEGMLVLDSCRYVVGSVELSYARIPRGYWEHRMIQARALGANTIMVRVPWMLHEEQEGVFNFEGEKDIKEFCRLAQANGLYVWLHVGPFIGEDIDFGGLPWWLLKDENITLRSHNKKFMGKVGSFYRALSQELSEMQISKGGPIIMINIEESNQIKQKNYIAALADTLRAVGFNETLFTSSTKSNNTLSIPNDILTAIVIDENNNAMNHFSGIKKKDPDTPVLCSGTEFYCDHTWGGERKIHNYNKRYMRVFEVFKGNGSMNIDFAFGGTSFGHLAGATTIDSLFVPYATSYDNGSLISEGGIISKEAERFAALYHANATQLYNKVYSPEYFPIIMPRGIKFTEYSPILSNITTSLHSTQPLTMEKCDVGYGAVLYETVLSNVQKNTKLCIEGIHDNAQIILGNKIIARKSRNEAEADILLPEIISNDTLRILVDAYGRLSNGKDYKGIVGKVTLIENNGEERELTGWKNYPLPSLHTAAGCEFKPIKEECSIGYYRTTFKCSKNGDFYIYTGNWGRGEAWINGHSLGRYSQKGPQRTLYVPGCWLNESGENELVILDYVGLRTFEVECLINSIL